MTHKVVVLHSGMAGAPGTTLTTLGGLIAVLDGGLVNGFNAVGITSITRSGTVATVTTTSTHNFEHGRIVLIEGADQAAYNGRKHITVTGTATFTFEVTGDPATPATGTMTSKYAPAGWTKPITGTNVAGYLTGAPSLGHYMQVEDTNPYADSNVGARTGMVVGMSGIDTGTQLGEQIRIQKAAGTWVMVADYRTCYLIMNGTNVFHFGEFDSYKSDDAFNWFQTRGENASILVNVLGANQTCGRNYPALGAAADARQDALGVSILRDVSQVGGHVNGALVYPCAFGTDSFAQMGGTQQFQLPNAADNSVPMFPAMLVERGVGVWRLRGQHRGLYLPAGRLDGAGFLNNIQNLLQTTIDGQPRRFVVCRFGASNVAQIAFDVTDSWD
jgi:hypothetical protein